MHNLQIKCFNIWRSHETIISFRISLMNVNITGIISRAVAKHT